MRVVRWLLGLIMVVGVVLTLMPFAVKWYLIDQLEDKGYQARIRHIGFDFIFSEITLYDVDIRSADGEGLSLLSASIDLEIMPLAERRLVITKAKLDSARLDVRRADDDLVVAGFSQKSWESKLGRYFVVEIKSAAFVNSEVCQDYQAQCLRIEDLHAAAVELEQANAQWTFTHNGPLRVEKAFVRERVLNTTLFYGGELNIERGRYTTDLVDVTGVRLQNIQFIENNLAGGEGHLPYQTQIGELVLASLKWQASASADASHLEIGRVVATSVRQALHKGEDGQLLLPERMRVWLTAVGQQLADNKLGFTLAEFDAQDGAVVWTDQSVSPPAMEQLSSLKVFIGSIDSSAATTSTPFTLAGKVGAAGHMKLDGNWFPFLKPVQFSFSGLLESLDVGKLSGYTPLLLDQRVEQGQVDVAVTATAASGRVQAATRWQWTDFVIQPGPKSPGNMPLELAYDLLKDHNNSVKFSVEVNGDIGSNTVSLRYILATQARRTLSAMARSQVGGAGAITIKPPTAAQRLTFEPLYYQPNARYPGEEDQRRLADVAKLMIGKAHLKMTFCAVVTGNEWAEIYRPGTVPTADMQLTPEERQGLLDLGSARGKLLLSLLKEAGVATNQIVICNPRVDMAQSGLSYMSVSL